MASGFLMPDGTDFDAMFELAVSGQPTGRNALPRAIADQSGGSGVDYDDDGTIITQGNYFRTQQGQDLLDRYMSKYAGDGNYNDFPPLSRMLVYADVQVNVNDPLQPTTPPFTGSGYIDLSNLFKLKNTYVPNYAPYFVGNPPTSVTVGSGSYSYTIVAQDANGDALTYSAITLPSWMNFNPSTRVLSGTPSSANVGPHSVTIRVSDGELVANKSFTITVNAAAVPQPPVYSPNSYTMNGNGVGASFNTTRTLSLSSANPILQTIIDNVTWDTSPPNPNINIGAGLNPAGTTLTVTTNCSNQNSASTTATATITGRARNADGWSNTFTVNATIFWSSNLGDEPGGI